MKKPIMLMFLISLLLIILQGEGGARAILLSLNMAQETKQVMSNPNPVIPVTVSAYSPTEEECDSDPYVTAYQRPVKEGTIAISRDLENEFGWRLGDRIHITGLGEFVVWDRMHPRWKKRVDIFFHDTEKAVSFGIKQTQMIKIDNAIPQGT
ncbi:MAG: hypothetical protein AAB275_06935 [Deltaproteobacteria bacterium]